MEAWRLFVALALPDAVREAVIGWRDQAIAGIDGLRAVAPGALHLTLCFLGSQDAGAVPAIAAACAAAGGERAPSLSLGAPVWLPARRPRVLAVEIEDRSGALGRVQAALAAALAAGGWYEPEGRRFRAHVTVARVAGRDTRVRARELDPPAPLQLTATRMVLYRSRLLPGGAEYEALAEVALGPAPG